MYKDPTKDILKSIHALEILSRDPFKQVHSTLERLNRAPHERMSKALEALKQDSFEKMHKHIRSSLKSLNRDPLKEVRKSMEFLNRDPYKYASKTLEALKQDSFEKMHKHIRSSLKSLNRDPYKYASKTLESLNRDPFKNIQSILQNIDSNPLKRLRETMEYLKSDHLSKLLASEDQNDILQGIEGIQQPLMDIGAYAINGEAVISLCQNTNLNDDKFAEELMTYLERILEKLAEQRPKALGLSFYLGVLITVINVWYSDYSSTESEKRISEQISAMGNKLSDKIKALIENDLEQQTFYIVKRKTFLRSKPKGKARRILVLYPNQKTELKVKKGKWIQVEFFDYLNETYVTGWVKKKYLKSCKLN